MSYDMSAPAPKKSNPWLIVLAVLGGGMVLGFGCCFGVPYLFVSKIKAEFQAPINAVVDELNRDAAITEKLGEPIEASFDNINIRDFQVENNNGTAEGSFNVSGPNATARVDAKIRLTNGEWSVDSMTVTSNGEVINE